MSVAPMIASCRAIPSVSLDRSTATNQRLVALGWLKAFVTNDKHWRGVLSGEVTERGETAASRF